MDIEKLREAALLANRAAEDANRAVREAYYRQLEEERQAARVDRDNHRIAMKIEYTPYWTDGQVEVVHDYAWSGGRSEGFYSVESAYREIANLIQSWSDNA